MTSFKDKLREKAQEQTPVMKLISRVIKEVEADAENKYHFTVILLQDGEYSEDTIKEAHDILTGEKYGLDFFYKEINNWEFFDGEPRWRIVIDWMGEEGVE